MFICFVVVAAVMGASFNKNTGNIPSGPAGAILAFECLFTAGFAWSWGPLGWLVPSEFHNIETRSLGQVRDVLERGGCSRRLRGSLVMLLPHCMAACVLLRLHIMSRAAAECSPLHTAQHPGPAAPLPGCIWLLYTHIPTCPALASPPCCVAVQAITTCVNFIFSFVIGQVYLTMLCHMEFGTYIFFAFWVAVMTIYVMFFLPETKGVPIEEMGFVWR